MQVAVDVAPFLVALSKKDALPLYSLTVLAIVVENPGIRQSQLLREFDLGYSRQALHNFLKKINSHYDEPLLTTSKGEVQGLFATERGEQVVRELKEVLMGTLRVGMFSTEKSELPL